jgi:drug/metabolite transporter (DMT)-like permease
VIGRQRLSGSRRRYRPLAWAILLALVAGACLLTWRDIAEGGIGRVLLGLGAAAVLAWLSYRDAKTATRR